MSTTHLAKFDGLVKRYGDTTALEGLSLEVPEGTVCGLLGPNGAGKTTAIRILLGLATATEGSATLLGERPGTPGFAAAVRQVGTLIEGPAIYARATPRQNMEIEASARKLRNADRQIDELLALVGLTERADTRSGAFSLGMKQRLGLAISLLGGPRLVVLDEPTNGLDPAGIVEIRELIKLLPGRGTTVLVCSQLLAEVELMCHRATIIRRWRLVAEGTIDELLASYGTSFFMARVGALDAERAEHVLVRSGLLAAQLGEGRLAITGPVHRRRADQPPAGRGRHLRLGAAHRQRRSRAGLPVAHQRPRRSADAAPGDDLMNAELRKLLALPTPRWTLFATIFAVAVAALVSSLAGFGSGEDMLPVQLGIGLATSVGAIVLGAWMIGLEYGSRTIRRALSADPGRMRLLLAKLGIVLGAVTVVTAVLSLASAPLFSAIASAHGESLPITEALEYGLAALANNLIYATVAFALALLTRSMAGGMALALVFAFVIDSLLSAIPVVGDYALSAAVLELMQGISGDEPGMGESSPDVLAALGVTAVWIATLVGISTTRFLRTDVD